MKNNRAVSRRINKRFVIIGIIFCFLILSTVKAEAVDNNKLVTLPTEITGDDASGFNGGTCPAPYEDVNNIDIVSAFIGEDRESFFVAIPLGRYITFSFPDSINDLIVGKLTIETTGADGATGQVSAVLNDNTEQILGSIRENKETQKTTFLLKQDCISNLKAIKIEGTNNAGKYPGADVVSIYIETGSNTFILGRDNNSFCHYASSERASGFYGIKNHEMDLDYIKALAKDAKVDAGGFASLLLNANWPSDGWCFGIAATMGLVHDRQIDVKTITSDTAKNYFEMSPPCRNDNLKNAINYYFEAQNHISSGTGVYTTIPPGMISGDTIRVSEAAMDFHSFLKGIVRAAESNDLVFGMPGHAVLITDCIKNDDDTYTLLVFDENSVTLNNPYGAFGTIDIDISSFKMEYTDYNGNIALSSEQSANAQLYYASTTQVAASTKEGIKTAKNRSLLKIPRNKPVRIVDRNGDIMIQTIDGTIESKVPVFDVRQLVCRLSGDESEEETEYVVLETDKVDSITVETDSYDNVEVSLTDSDNTARLSGQFSKATLDMNEGISIDGEAYDFHAGISANDTDKPEEKQVVMMSGSWGENVQISKNTDKYSFDITSEGINDAEIEFYDGNDINAIDNIDPYGHTYIGEKEEEHQHTFTEWTVTRAATEVSAGEQTRTCTVCGYTETQAIPQIAPSVAPAAPAEIVDLPTVKISKPKAAKKKVTVKWKKVSKKNLKKISGIQIQVATDPGFTNIVKTATAGKKKTSKTIKGLQSKTKYYVRIRAYAAGNHVSNWKTKSVKVK